jgi:endonuclease/exonuclease/phosphatase family metal-dependent hydrolase
MDSCSKRFVGLFLQKLAGFAASLTGLTLVIETAGCASGRPAPILVTRPATALPAGDPDRDLSLKLLTFNIWGLPSWMTGARSGRYPHIARELERLDPDIVLLQEAWTAKARKAAPADGRWSICRAAGQHTFFQQSGLMTLSRYPVLGGEFYPFSRASFPDRFVNKGVLKVTVQLAGGSVLNIWNAHLQDGGAPEIKLSQIREIASQVQAADDGQIADLVGGDFNCTPESSSFHELEAAFGPSVQELAGMNAFVTWDGLSAKPGAGRTFDYLFIRSRTGSQHVEGIPQVVFAAANRTERLSDHFGVEAVVNFSSDPRLTDAVGPLVQSPLPPETEALPAVLAARSLLGVPESQSGFGVQARKGLAFHPALSP